MSADSFYALNFNKPDGTAYPVAELKGKTILVVNTATQCGLTPQFEGLELLHAKYEDKGLVILGFPCNQFGNQEPETNETMVETCAINHGVTFQLLEKTEVNGKNEHAVFKWLKSRSGGFLGKRIKWNFTKFLVSPDGKTVKRFAPITKPEKIETDILKFLQRE